MYLFSPKPAQRVLCDAYVPVKMSAWLRRMERFNFYLSCPLQFFFFITRDVTVYRTPAELKAREKASIL